MRGWWFGLLLLACAGCASNEIVTPVISPSSAAATVPMTVNITIRTDAASALHRDYISASTAGIGISYGAHPATFPAITTPSVALNVTSGSASCTTSGSTRTCSATVPALVGTDDFQITAWNGAPVSGSFAAAKELSTVTISSRAVQLGVANTLSATLDGVVASFTVTGLPSGTAGTSFSSKTFSVTALDASGKTILGTYENPITLSDSDTSGATTIATSGADSPPSKELLSSSDAASISYTGLAIAGATITASASGATNGSATFTPTLNAITPSSLTGGIVLNFASPYNLASTVSYTASEVGWTNSPYDKTLTMTLASCSVGTLSQSGNTFSVTGTTSGSGTCTLVIRDGNGETLDVPIGKDVFEETGSAQSFTVPTGVSLISIYAAGGAGYKGGTSTTTTAAGADGGSVTGTFSVSAGTSYSVYAGGEGEAGTGGYNGGGAGCPTADTYFGGGGGGESDVRSGSTPFIVGAGGGGGAGLNINGTGGSGGGTTGGTGGGYAAGIGGSGATQSAGGAGGSYTALGGTSTASNGAAYSGGAAACFTFDSDPNEGGGGGAGYYGGGGGSGYGGGGGGGSSWISSSASNVNYETGTNSGNGFVWIYW